MKLPVRKPRNQPENTITLINVVFLMLIFFLVAGTLAPPMDGEIAMIETSEAERAAPPDGLAVRADGSVSYRGETVTLEDWAEAYPPAEGENGTATPKLVVDRDLPAEDLVGLAAEMRALGFETITVVTERAMP